MPGEALTEKQYIKENQKRFNALLVSLRRMVYVPDEYNKEYRDYIDGILVTFGTVFASLMNQQMGGAIDLEVAKYTAMSSWYVEAASAAGYTGRVVVDSGKLVTTMMESRLPTGYTLSQRIWDFKNYSKDIEAIIRNGITNNLHKNTIAKQLDSFLLPHKKLTTITPYGRTLSSDSLRVAQTEIWESYRRGAVEYANQAPWITGLTWTLSAAHMESCECDDLAGITFSPSAVPMAPHPRCQCSLEAQMLSKRDWKQLLRDVGIGVAAYGIYDWLEG